MFSRKQAAHRDGSVSLLARTEDQDGSSVAKAHTQAVKRDRQGVDGLLESGALVGVASLEEPVSATNPYSRLGVDGRSVEAMGLLLNPDGSGLRFENLELIILSVIG